MKTKEERSAIEAEAANRKCAELSEEDLSRVTSGSIQPHTIGTDTLNPGEQKRQPSEKPGEPGGEWQA